MNRNTLIAYALGPVGSALLGFISLPLIAWFFPVQAVGQIALFQVSVSLSVLLFSLGLDQAFVREYHGYRNPSQLLQLCLLPGLVLLIIFSSLLYWQLAELPAILLFEQNDRRLTILLFLCFLLAFISRFLSLILRMEERALAYSMSLLLPKLLFLLFVLSGIWLGLESDLNRLLTAHTLSMAAVCALYLWNTRKTWLPALNIPVSPVSLNPLLKFALPLLIGGLSAWGLNVSDKLFLRYLADFSELGVYSVTVSIAAVATLFAGIFNTIWSPLVYRWQHEGKADTEKLNRVAEHLLAAIYFAVLLACALAWLLPWLLPKDYDAIRYLMPACLMSPLLYTLSEANGVGISLARKTVYAMLASLLAMLFNFFGNYLLIPEYGAVGAAASTLIAFTLFYGLRTEFSRRVWRPLPRAKPYGIIALLVVHIQANLFFLNNGFIFYLLTAFLFFAGIIIFRFSIDSFFSFLGIRLDRQ